MESVEAIAAQRFQRLREYLDEGWWIDPPVFVRPLWQIQHGSQEAYHFILKRQERLHLMVVPCSAEVERFVSESRLALNHL